MRRRVAFAEFALLVGSCACLAAPTRAFDFFGLWPGAETPPGVTSNAIAYVVSFDVHGAGSGVESALRDASALYSLRRDSPPDGESLARRAARDFGPLVDALWANGYFNAKLTFTLDGVALDIAGNTGAFARAAEAYRNRAPAPVKVEVETGPSFHLRRIETFGRDGRALELPVKAIGLKEGDVASAEKIRAAEAALVDAFRADSRPLAKIVAVRPVVDHPAEALDVTIVVDPGPRAGIGDVAIEAPASIPESVIRSFVYLQQGDPYSPDALERTRLSVRSLPAVGSARFVEKSFLDPNSDLPLDLEVGGRPEHAIGASAQYSTIDGPVGQVYWEDRNLLGGAEYLRLQGDLLYAPNTPGARTSAGALGNTDIGGRIAAHFVKPALGGSRNDLLVDAKAERVGTSYGHFVGYTVDDADVTTVIRHRFSDQLSLQAGLEAQRGLAVDVLGKVDYTLVGAPVTLNYDSTDDKLDPTRGFRVLAQLEDSPKFLGSSLDLFMGRASISAYRALDDGSRFILAGRLEAGGETGAPLAEIPANLRFYAGGGGSVRGYPYYSLGPLAPGGAVIGGRSLFDGSVELRAKVTDAIGVVPFFDAGDAFANSWPDFSAPLRMAVGLGLRYYTSFGPLRLDLATPVNPRPGDPRFAAYVSIGQAF